MISAELRTEIRRLFFGEHWTVGTIVSQLNLHRDTVERALGVDSFASRGNTRPSVLDPYRELIRSTLEQYPRLSGTRVFEMVKGRGYEGRSAQVRRYIRKHDLRPRPQAEAYLRWNTLPGEQAQADWAHLGTLRVDGCERKLSAFVMTLSYSRALSVTFSLDQRLASVLRGHVEAFQFFGGVPRTILYDNMKTVVLERVGEAIRFHPQLLELQSHYLFAAKPCFPGRPNEKGKVERAIRYLRRSFLAGRHYADLDDLRQQMDHWRQTVAHARPCPGDSMLTVVEALERDRTALLPLPEHPFPCAEVRPVIAKKQPYITFDTNQYSIPHQWVGHKLTLSASENTVQILNGTEIVASHQRSWNHQQTIHDEKHLAALAAEKRRGKATANRNRLLEELPEAETLLQILAKQHVALGLQVGQMLILLDLYGPDVMRNAIAVAVERNTPRAQSVAWIIEKILNASRPTEPLRDLGRPEVDDLHVNQHNLEDYDDL